MDPNSISQAMGAGALATTTKKPSQTLDKNAFLQLLVAQLKNQDPSQAQDSTQMVQQMTSFASLEQMQNTNDLLKGIQVQNVGLFQAQASGLVGKQVRVGSQEFQLSDGKGRIGLDLPAEAIVTVTIKDASGKIVRTLEQGQLRPGSHVVEWDGRDGSGKTLPDGVYTTDVSALDGDGNPVGATTTAFARVESVIFADGLVYVIAGGKRYSLSEISEIAA